jgi:hypothetical protein
MAFVQITSQLGVGIVGKPGISEIYISDKVQGCLSPKVFEILVTIS